MENGLKRKKFITKMILLNINLVIINIETHSKYNNPEFAIHKYEKWLMIIMKYKYIWLISKTSEQ